MRKDRDELVKQVFPEIRRLCEQRGVLFSEIDLRWGVTEAQVDEGAVLEICLDEIDRCRPYFIGLLGERYGWVPDEVDARLTGRMPWLQKRRGRSVTELEMVHGVLEDPGMADHAFFYLRDPEYGTERESDTDKRRRLVDLKQEILDSGFPTRTDYRGPKHLAELVRADLISLVDRLYPEGDFDPIEAEVVRHEALANEHLQTWTDRPTLEARLDAFADDPSSEVIAVLGGPGSGKSALLGSWAVKRRQRKPTNAESEVVAIHFVGCSSRSAEPEGVLEGLLFQLGGDCDLSGHASPSDLYELQTRLSRRVEAVAADRSVVLVVDGLDKLADRPGAAELAFLAAPVEGAKLVISSGGGETDQVLQRRGWLADPLWMHELDSAERERLIEARLARYTKGLEPVQIDRIGGHPQAGKPVFLSTLLDELRASGDFDRLDARIDELLAAVTVDDLVELIFARFEEDYEGLHSGLTGRFFTLISTAREGLTERELGELLGDEQDGEPLPLPFRIWGPLRNASAGLVRDSAGRLTLESFVDVAVGDRYLRSAELRAGAHRELADYFTAGGLSARAIEEAPWHLAACSDWGRLADLLSSPNWLIGLKRHDLSAPTTLWQRIDGESDIEVSQRYEWIWSVDRDALSLEALQAIAIVLEDLGEADAAVRALGLLEEEAARRGEVGVLAFAVGNQVALLDRAPGEGAVEDLALRWVDMARISGDRGELGRALVRRGEIEWTKGDLEEASKLLVEAERIGSEDGYGHLRGYSLARQAAIHAELGNSDASLRALDLAEVWIREVGATDLLFECLCSRIETLLKLARIEEAEARLAELQKTAAISERPFVAAWISACSSRILAHRGENRAALTASERAVEGYRRHGDRWALLTALERKVHLHNQLGESERAMRIAAEGEEIARAEHWPIPLQAFLGVRAGLLMERGDLQAAIPLVEEQGRICNQVGSTVPLVEALMNHANLHHRLGNVERATFHLDQHEELCREGDLYLYLADGLRKRAEIALEQGSVDSAAECAQERERIYRQVGSRLGLARVLAQRALIAEASGDIRSAYQLHAGSEEIHREIGNPAGVATALASRASIYLHADSELRLQLAAGGSLDPRSMLAEALDLARASGRAALVTAIEERLSSAYDLSSG